MSPDYPAGCAKATIVESVAALASEYLFLTQRFARHASPVTTVAYTHPSDEELYAKIGRL